MSQIKIFLAALLLGANFVVTAQGADVIFNPLELQRTQNIWQLTHEGESTFNGLPIIVTLEETPITLSAEPPTRGLKIKSLNMGLEGNAVLRPSQQKLYRLGLHVAKQPNLCVYFSLDKIERTVNGKTQSHYVSSKNNLNDTFKFTIDSAKNNTLTVTYVRNQGGQIVESGTFDLNPALNLQRN